MRIAPRPLPGLEDVSQMDDAHLQLMVLPDVTARDLSTVRRLIGRVGTEVGLEADRVERLILAANEIVANAIRYGRGTATVTVRPQVTDVTVEVTDEGPGLPEDMGTQLPAPGALHGRGLWLARQLCDEMDVQSGPGGTRVRLVMTVAPRQVA